MNDAGSTKINNKINQKLMSYRDSPGARIVRGASVVGPRSKKNKVSLKSALYNYTIFHPCVVRGESKMLVIIQHLYIQDLFIQ